MFRCYPLHHYLEKQLQNGRRRHHRCCHRLVLAITTPTRPAAYSPSSTSISSFSTKVKRPNFHSWYAREEKEERSRLALASYLRDLYAVQSSSSADVSSSSLSK